MKQSWFIYKENEKLSAKLAKYAKMNPLTAQLMINRGVDTEKLAELYLNSTLFDLPSPFLLKGMDTAVDRVISALKGNEKIAVYGDYDVDGVTSTALLYSFLKSLGGNVVYYNPDRLSEGYGLNLDAVGKLHESGVALIISCDCGITAVEEVREANRLGMDFIVTDHHKAPETLPEAVSIIDPHQSGCSYPGKEVSGVGVTFNLVMALRRALRDDGFFSDTPEPNLGDYLDLVALGTVADLVPLVNVNRIMVQEGLRRMKAPKRIGIAALKRVSGLNGMVTAPDLGFRLGPRINASGRLSSSKTAVELMITDDSTVAQDLAAMLNKENQRRQNIEMKIYLDAVDMVESNPAYAEAETLVLASAQWHQGVIGIVASRIVNKYDLPAALIAIGEDGQAKGSARSVKGLDLYAALSECRELFSDFGGHEQAAGFSMNEDKIDKFREMFERSVSGVERKYVPKFRIDSIVGLDVVDESFVKDLDKLSPFGVGNPEPLFLAKSVKIVSKRVINNKHLSLRFGASDKYINAMWFNMKADPGDKEYVDIVYTPEISEWKGKTEVRLRILDMD